MAWTARIEKRTVWHMIALSHARVIAASNRPTQVRRAAGISSSNWQCVWSFNGYHLLLPFWGCLPLATSTLPYEYIQTKLERKVLLLVVGKAEVESKARRIQRKRA